MRLSFVRCWLYDAKKMAKAIVEGILNKTITENYKPYETNFKNGDYSGRKARVIADVLNVRFDRGTTHKVIGQLKKGQQVKLEWCQDKWISIEGFRGNRGLGYIHVNYLELI